MVSGEQRASQVLLRSRITLIGRLLILQAGGRVRWGPCRRGGAGSKSRGPVISALGVGVPAESKE